MSNKLKLTITIILTVSIILSATGFYLNNLAFETSRIQPILEEKFLGKFTEIGNYSDKDYYNQREPEIILTKYDLIKPTYTILLSGCILKYSGGESQPKNECNYFNAIVFYLERTGILTWKVKDFNSGNISNTNLDKVRNLLKNNDLLTLPKELDGQIISAGQKLTPEQIAGLPAIQARLDRDAAFKKLPPEEQYKQCLESLNNLLQGYTNFKLWLADNEAGRPSTVKKQDGTEFNISEKQYYTPTGDETCIKP
jgi:hypothetical protein